MRRGRKSLPAAKRRPASRCDMDRWWRAIVVLHGLFWVLVPVMARPHNRAAIAWMLLEVLHPYAAARLLFALVL